MTERSAVEEALYAIMLDCLNGKLTLIEALREANARGYADGRDDG